MSTRPCIYLCGPIQGLEFGPANTWRLQAAQQLAPEFDVLNPLRGKDESVAFANGTTRFSDAFIVSRDLADIRHARAVLRFYDGVASHGSDMETFYAAHVCGVPVVTFGTRTPREALSIWLRHHTVANVADLASAVAFLKAMFLRPGEEGDTPYDPRAYAALRYSGESAAPATPLRVASLLRGP